jgi:phospholipid-binding lipoprotein MlaA
MFRPPVCLFAILLLCAPAEARATEARAAEASAVDMLNGYNHVAFGFNQALWSWFDGLVAGDHAAVPATGAPATGASVPGTAVASRSSGPVQVISNLVNEPMTLLSSLVVGDLPTAWNAVQRFGINSTVGVLGWWDEARAWGYEPVPADVGLSLCRMGVGEGGYVVLPFVGPRTYRDAAADVVLMNILLWTATAAVLNSGVSLQTIIVAEAVEVAADVVATRQIDPQAKDLHFDDFDKMRAGYLAERRQRCAGDSAMAIAEAAKP